MRRIQTLAAVVIRAFALLATTDTAQAQLPVITMELVQNGVEGSQNGILRFTRTGPTTARQFFTFRMDLTLTPAVTLQQTVYQPRDFDFGGVNGGMSYHSSLYGWTSSAAFEIGESTIEKVVFVNDDNKNEPQLEYVTFVFYSPGTPNWTGQGSVTMTIEDNE